MVPPTLPGEGRGAHYQFLEECSEGTAFTGIWMIWGGRGRGVFPKRSSIGRSPFLSPLVIGETGFSLGFCFGGFCHCLLVILEGGSCWACRVLSRIYKNKKETQHKPLCNSCPRDPTQSTFYFPSSFRVCFVCLVCYVQHFYL